MLNPENSSNSVCVEEELELATEFSWTLYANSRLTQFENAENIECVNEAELISAEDENERSYF